MSIRLQSTQSKKKKKELNTTGSTVTSSSMVVWLVWLNDGEVTMTRQIVKLVKPHEDFVAVDSTVLRHLILSHRKANDDM